MEVFGWIMLIVLALIGVGTIAAFVGPNVVEKVKTIIYQAKKFAQVAKEYIDTKVEIRRAKNAAKLAAKQNKQQEKVEEAKDDEPVEEVKQEQVVEESKPVEQPKAEENTTPVQEQNVTENEPVLIQEPEQPVTNNRPIVTVG